MNPIEHVFLVLVVMLIIGVISKSATLWYTIMAIYALVSVFMILYATTYSTILDEGCVASYKGGDYLISCKPETLLKVEIEETYFRALDTASMLVGIVVTLVKKVWSI